MRIENWCGYDIRFIELDGEWYAILKDICDALHLRTDKIASRLDPSMLERVLVDTSDHLSRVDRYERKSVDRIDRGMIGKDIGRQPGENKTRWMLAVNELGIYEALFASRKLEARKFRMLGMGSSASASSTRCNSPPDSVPTRLLIRPSP